MIHIIQGIPVIIVDEKFAVLQMICTSFFMLSLHYFSSLTCLRMTLDCASTERTKLGNCRVTSKRADCQVVWTILTECSN